MTAGIRIGTHLEDPFGNIPAPHGLTGILGVAQEQLLMQENCHGATLDQSALITSPRWTRTVTGAGNHQLLDGVLSLFPTAAASSSAQILSKPLFPLQESSTLILRAMMRFAGTPVANNIREIGFYGDASNYMMIVLDGTTLYSRVYMNGAAFATDQQAPPTIFNPSNLTYTRIMIRATKNEVRFYANAIAGGRYQLVGQFDCTGTQGALQELSNVQVIARTINSTSAADNQLHLTSLSVSRLYHAGLPAANRVDVINQASDKTIFNGSGELIGYWLTTANAQVWRLMDADTSTDVYVDYSGPASAEAGAYHPLGILCPRGLKFDHVAGATADKVHVLYQS